MTRRYMLRHSPLRGARRAGSCRPPLASWRLTPCTSRRGWPLTDPLRLPPSRADAVLPSLCGSNHSNNVVGLWQWRHISSGRHRFRPVPCRFHACRRPKNARCRVSQLSRRSERTPARASPCLTSASSLLTPAWGRATDDPPIAPPAAAPVSVATSHPAATTGPTPGIADLVQVRAVD
jgi:hypothetical protein